MEPLSKQTILKPSDHPKTIYKFRDWKDKFHKSIITKRDIYFPSPKEFNDPFDCRIPESFYMLNTEEKIEKYVNDFIIRNLNKLKAKNIDIPQYVNLLKKDLKENPSIYQKKLNEIYLKEGNLYFGVFCTSKIWNNILMWTHYSANHTGFCVGFNRKQLVNFLYDCNVASVIYTKEFPQIDPFDDFIQKMFQKSHSKANNWKYEKEYRFFLNSYPNKLSMHKRIRILPKECYRCIIIGLSFPKDQINIIKRLSDALNVPLYQVIIDNQTFKLKRKRINFA